MYQIDNSTVSSTLPTPAAPGTPGYFTKGDPSGATLATILDQDFLNSVMLELCNVVTGAGITLNKTNYTQVLQAIQQLTQSPPYAVCTTNSNTYVASLSPAPVAYTNGQLVIVKFSHGNTGAGAATLNLNSLGAISITLTNGLALPVYAIVDGMIAIFVFDGTNLQLLNPNRTKVKTIVPILSSETFTVPAGIYELFVEGWGNAGSGGGSPDGTVTGGGGGGGAYAASYIPVVPGQTFTVTISAAAAAAPINSSANGNDGGVVSFGGIVIPASGKKGMGSTGTGISASGGVGGKGGLASASTGQICLSGQDGWSTNNTNAAVASGYGGSSPRNTQADAGNNAGVSFAGLANSGQGGQGGSVNSASGIGGTGMFVVTY